MSTAPSIWQHLYHFILLHPTEPRILVLPEENGWRLPSFQKEEKPALLSEISGLIRQQLDIDAIVLYCAYLHVDEEHARREQIYVLEIPDPSWVAPADIHWIGLDALAHLDLIIPEQRSIIATCLDESEVAPALRPPWARRGWFREAMDQVGEQLTRLKYNVVAPVEQVKTWGLSCVLRVPTSAGNVYFKAIPTSFMKKNSPIASSNNTMPLLITHEPMFIQSLAAWYPQNLPALLAMDRERCWMLIAEFGADLYDHPDKADREKALAVYARMQVTATEHIDSLLAAGCLDRRLNVLETQIDPLLSNGELLADLERSEVEQLRASVPWLKAMCQELARGAIPQTLVHGDLHTGNIARQNDSYIYFDWAEACIAHPFFDAAPFLDNVDDLVERERLRDIYLAQWMDYASIENLRDIFSLAQILATIHQAVSYQHIMANMEDPTRQIIRGAVVYWLRILLRLLHDYS